MYYSNLVSNSAPQAFVTSNKLRLKQHDKIVYLDNNSTFELELFNPTQFTVLAKIKLNGNYIPGGGIVVKPGQRVYLERYLDDDKKFKFETYNVDGTSVEVLNAIQNNGDVKVEFYNEVIKPTLTVFNSPYIYYNSTTIGTPTMTYTSTGFDGTLSTSSSTSYNFGNPVGTKSLGKLRSKSTLTTDSIETGRIEKGEKSDQTFTKVNMDFNSYYTTLCEWKIMPTSTKVYDSSDIGLYCAECGAKRKKTSFKFCPHCGTKF